ncbi:MAG: hypothetical protein V4496_03460 [Pseudomonadota bacterium]
MMSEKDKLSFNEGEEEEFHITDEDIDRELAAMETDHLSPPSDEASSEATMDKPPAKNRFAILKQLKRKHWIIIVAIIIILLVGLLKMVGSSQSEASFGQITPVVPVTSNSAELATKKSSADLTKAVFESSTSTPKTTASASLLPAPTLSAPPSAVAKTDLTAGGSNDAKLTQMLEAIQQQNQLLTQQLTALSSRVVGLESNLTQSSQAVQGLSQQMGALKKVETPPTPLPQLTQSVATGPQYTVEAVVPQRAWLQAGDGSTVTVMIGDDVPGLGAVVSIDPYSGNVTTASGTVIKYGS